MPRFHLATDNQPGLRVWDLNHAVRYLLRDGPLSDRLLSAWGFIHQRHTRPEFSHMALIPKEERQELEAEFDRWLGDVSVAAGAPATATNLEAALSVDEMEKLAVRLHDISISVAKRYGQGV